MSQLFIDLYRYREREKKHNLEDWFTECLAAILRLLTADQWNGFLESLTGETADLSCDFIASLEVVTQYRTDKFGRPDIVIFADGAPFVVFENKVHHSISHGEDKDKNPENQLERYAEWLAQSDYAGPVPKTLVFLSHLTSPPPGFETSQRNQSYSNLACRIQSWGVLARCLKNLMDDEDPDSHRRYLAEAFYKMLENEGMSTEFPRQSAISILEIFIENSAVLKNLIDKMWRCVEIAGNFGSRSARVIGPHLEIHAYSASRYILSAPNNEGGRSYLETGIMFFDPEQGWEEYPIGATVAGPYVFLTLANDYSGHFEDINEEPEGEGWCRPETDFWIHKPLSDFSGGADDRAAKILAWCTEQAQNLDKFLVKNKVTDRR